MAYKSEKQIQENEEIVKVLTSMVKTSQVSKIGIAKKIVLVLSLIIYPLSLYCARIHPDAGSTSAAFLKIPVGSRASAMAGAMTSASDDIWASFYNPAGLAYMGDKTFSFMHNDYISDLTQVYTVYGLKGKDIDFLKKYTFLKKGVWSISANYFFTRKDMERRSGLYEGDPLYPISPVEGKFRAWDLALGLHYGFNYDPYTAVGVSLKFITQSIDNYRGSAPAMDLGVMKKFEMYDRVFSWGGAVENIGPGIKMKSTRYNLPLAFKTGISHRILETGTLVSFDVWKYIDNYPYFMLGLEHSLGDKLFIRTGYRYRMYGNELGAWSGFNAGIGFIYGRLNFDYAFSPYGDLGYSHKLTVTLKFQPPKPPEIISVRMPVKEAEKILDSKTSEYVTSFRVKKITPYYSEYDISALNADGFILSISFKTRAKGEPEPALSVIAGKLPESLSSKIAFKNIYNAFQISYNGVILGSVKMEFKLEKSWFENYGTQKDDVELMYMTKEGFRSAELKFDKEDETFFYYSAIAPQSTHYVLGTK